MERRIVYPIFRTVSQHLNHKQALSSQKKFSTLCLKYKNKIYQNRSELNNDFSHQIIYGHSVLLQKYNNYNQVQNRGLWAWLNTVFNKVDESRIKAVGPDRACAEWLLRCGAIVKWKDSEGFTRDYNSLPPAGGRRLTIEEIDATDSAIMHIGFPHFRGCKNIRRIILHKATYMTDDALAELHYLTNSLQELQISSCGNITLEGLRHLGKLRNLAYLHIYDLPQITDKDEAVKVLQNMLPHCAIVFPYAQAKDAPKSSENNET